MTGGGLAERSMAANSLAMTTPAPKKTQLLTNCLLNDGKVVTGDQ